MTTAKQIPYLLSRVVKLLDSLLVTYKLQTDHRLAYLLRVSPASISSFRHGHVKLGATALYRIALITNTSVNEIKAFLVGQTGDLKLGVGDFERSTKWIMFECSEEAASRLFDHVNELQKLRTDVQLAELLGLIPPTISNIRRGAIPLKQSVIVKIHEKTGMTLSEIFSILEKG